MNWRNGAIALAGGISGFLLVLLAHFWAIGVAIQSVGILGSSSSTGGQAFVFYFVVPSLMVAGGTLTAKTLGATWKRSLVAGVAALAVIVGILLLIPPYSNYSPFNENETLTLVSPAAVTVLVAIWGKVETNATRLTLVIGLAALLIFYTYVFRGYGIWVGLAAWALIPLSAGLFRQSD